MAEQMGMIGALLAKEQERNTSDEVHPDQQLPGGPREVEHKYFLFE
jgi:hypothetical protein